MSQSAAILAVGWTLAVLYAYPGVMSYDSFEQLHEGRAWFFTDAHPPVMAALWGIVDRVISGPLVMLLLQITTFLVGTYLILRRAMRPRTAAICACVVLLFPPIVTPLAVIWKDCLMAGVLALGIALVMDPRRWVRLVALGLFALATALRYNALAATFPLVVLLFEWKPGMRWFARYPLALGAWLVVVATAMGGNALLVDREMHYFYKTSALADIAGVLTHVDRDIPDAELRALLAPTGIEVDTGIHAALRAGYKPYDFEQVMSGDGRLWTVTLEEPMAAPRREAIARAWKDVVTTYPGAYLRYRLDVFAETLGLREKFQGATVIRHRNQNPYLLAGAGMSPPHPWRFQEKAQSWTLRLVKHTRLFRPHVYVLLALGLLLLTRRQRDVFAILISGLLMELTLIPLGWTPDYRFSHWLVTCACIGLVILFARRVSSRGRRDAVDLGAQDRKLASDVG